MSSRPCVATLVCLIGLCLVGPASAQSGSAPDRFWLDANDIFPRRLCVVRMIDGNAEGEATFYAESGDLCMIEHYADGVLNGERIAFYPSGNRFEQLSFVNGRAVGRQIRWFPNGVVASVREWVDGVMHGAVVTYFPNGNPMLEYTMVNGQFHGLRRHYRPDAVLIGTTTWSHGREVDRSTRNSATQADIAAIEDAGYWQRVQLKDVWR